MDDIPLRKRLQDILSPPERGAIRDAWNSASAAPDFAPLPAGNYECHVHSVKLFTARTGTPGVKVRFDVCEGEHAGRALFLDCWLTPAAMPRTKRDCQKLGFDSFEQLEAARSPSRRFRCKVRVALRRDDAGNEFNRVIHFDVLRVDEPERDPFAPIDDDATDKPEGGASCN